MPTLIPGDERQDEKNIGQEHADRRFNDLSGAEKRGTVDMSDFERNYNENADSTQEDANIERARRGESEKATGAPDSEFTNNVRGKPTKQKGRIKSWFKKASPALGIGGIFGIGGFVLIGLTSPSLLIVQMKEVMVGKFNTQLASMETRSSKLLASKMQGSTSGYCGSKLTIRCKFTTMSKKQVEKLKTAGIEVEGSDTIMDRKKPTALVFNGERIPPAEFSSRAAKDAEFRNALKRAYNPKYAGFVGKAWGAMVSKHKISKQLPELEAEDNAEEARKKLNDIAREGTESDTGRTRVVASDAECTTNCIDEAEANEINSKAVDVEDAKNSGSAASEIRSKLSGINAAGVGAAFKITGPVDSACQIYGGMTMLSYLAKTIRMSQMIRYSLIFFGVADAIKAGVSPDPADVALLGTIATSTIKDSADATKTLVAAGTDSFGYKYAAYNDSSASTQSMQIANRFTAGGGFIGEMSGVTSTVLGSLGGDRNTARTTCGVLANPIVQGASLVLGIASLFVPGANVYKIVGGMAGAAVFGVAVSIIPGLLADIVAGTVTEDIVGEEAVNAIASGAGGLMSDGLAGQNGNGPMTKEDTLAYMNIQSETAEQYIADELLETSPFDATNPHTFLGSIASALIPLRSSSNPITTLGSLLNKSFGAFIPTSSAATSQANAESLDVCQDLDVIETGYAADPFCNVIRGIPPQYLNRDPGTVAQDLIDRGLLSEEGTPMGEYADFINLCITNEEPLGYSEPDIGFSPSEAEGCIVDSDNANYYLNYMDQRIELGMNGEDVENSQATTVANAQRPDGAKDKGKGWTLEHGVDYSQYECDSRTEDMGVFKNPEYGFTVRLCKITHNTGVSGDNGGNQVASVISTNFMNMLEAAKGAGVEIGLSDGMRKTGYGSYSEHKYGLATDLGVPRGGNTICFAGVPSTRTGWGSLEAAQAACERIGGAHYAAYQWLNANAATYGFYNLETEPWHWSPSGT